MTHAIIYLTYNGLYNFTNGIGTQTQLLLRGLEVLQDTLAQQYGPLHLHMVCPQPDAVTWGFDAAFFQQQQQRLQALGGQFHSIPYKTHPEQDLWDVDRWHHLCASAAQLVAQLSRAYDNCLVIPIDQPWAQTAVYLAHQYPETLQRVRVLSVLYSTAFVRNATAPDTAEMVWERQGLALACRHANVFLADLCPSFSTHLRTFYHFDTAKFAPYTSSILVQDAEFSLLPEAEVTTTLRQYGVPLDVDLILCFGRATPLKGFDLLIPALGAVRQRCHFVLISVPYVNDDYPALYDRLIATHQIAATHIKFFTRDLPKALCQWPRTRMVVVPSQQETFSNIPLEVALWARHAGPVVVASRMGGFVDQIEDGVNGFFLEIASLDAMARTVQHVLDLSPARHAAIRQRAYDNVVQHYDFQRNFPVTLRFFWGQGF